MEGSYGIILESNFWICVYLMLMISYGFVGYLLIGI